jgi:hypothetical protein
LLSTTHQSARRALLALTAALSLAVSPVPAEEITLHNGQKIVGTIVGFEDDMFRVETEFGFALIRKDRVRSISFGPSSSKEAGQKPGERKNPPPAPKSAPSALEKATGSSLEATKPAAESAPVPVASSMSASPATAPAPAKAPPPPPVSRPLDEPLPTQIQERVEGNSYINDTFHFAMYKPPGWKIHEEAPRETGRAIVAMGPEDEQTFLIVERQVWSGPPDLKNDTTEANLRQTYQDYQAISESPTKLDGRPAVRRDFQGLMDGVEWHGVSVRVAEGNTVFGIIGLTSAETFQFQQALLNKIINSYRFLPGKP